MRVKSEFAVKGQIPLHIEYSDDDHDILISCRTDGRQGVLKLVPRAVTLGVGCHRNIELEALEKAFSEILEKSGVFPQAVFQAATIDLKKDEPALLEFCEKHDLPLRIFTADELMSVPGEFSGSEFVKKITGVDNVCERAAVLASGGHLINKKETASRWLLPSANRIFAGLDSLLLRIREKIGKAYASSRLCGSINENQR